MAPQTYGCETFAALAQNSPGVRAGRRPSPTTALHDRGSRFVGLHYLNAPRRRLGVPC
jgi:hypothetical protein